MHGVDAAYCTEWRRASVCMSVTTVSHAKPAELIEMPFGEGSSLVWAQGTSHEKGHFLGGGRVPIYCQLKIVGRFGGG